VTRIGGGQQQQGFQTQHWPKAVPAGPVPARTAASPQRRKLLGNMGVFLTCGNEETGNRDGGAAGEDGREVGDRAPGAPGTSANHPPSIVAGGDVSEPRDSVKAGRPWRNLSRLEGVARGANASVTKRRDRVGAPGLNPSRPLCGRTSAVPG